MSAAAAAATEAQGSPEVSLSISVEALEKENRLCNTNYKTDDKSLWGGGVIVPVIPVFHRPRPRFEQVQKLFRRVGRAQWTGVWSITLDQYKKYSWEEGHLVMRDDNGMMDTHFDLPACLRMDGSMYWLRRGFIHRLCGLPAVILPNTCIYAQGGRAYAVMTRVPLPPPGGLEVASGGHALFDMYLDRQFLNLAMPFSPIPDNTGELDHYYATVSNNGAALENVVSIPPIAGGVE
jgi:hypothetical protein